MSNLFSSAASLLLGEGESADEHVRGHVRGLLEALEYSTDATVPRDRVDDNEKLHRANLLRAASQFVRLFELAAPDAPGLVAFGAEIDPTLAGSLHRGAPLAGVSGVGLTAQAAFQGCVGEGVEYLSQLQSDDDLSARHEPTDRMLPVDPRGREL